MALKDIKVFKPLPKAYGDGPMISVSSNGEGKKYTVLIKTAIDEPHCYTQLVQILDTATEKDVIHILLCSPGGNLNTGLYVTSAMERSSAKVVTHPLQLAASCAAMMWAYGKERRVYPLSKPMFHTASGGFGGRTGNVIETAQNVSSKIEEFLRDERVTSILTEEELEACFENKKDVYLNYNDLLERSGVVSVPIKNGGKEDDNVPDVKHDKIDEEDIEADE